VWVADKMVDLQAESANEDMYASSGGVEDTHYCYYGVFGSWNRMGTDWLRGRVLRDALEFTPDD